MGAQALPIPRAGRHALGSCPDVLSPGDSIGAYEVVARLRDGGMATLFLGKRRGASGFEKPVAIKVVHSRYAFDETLKTMLVDEARIAVQVRHPNVVAIEDLGEHAGQPFIAMEFVHGASVAQLLEGLSKAGRRMSPLLATHIAIQVAAALHAAHEARDPEGNALELVHRDVSPSNVLVSRDGHVKVIDFGVAKARGRAVQTSAGALKGKFGYMAPEQARGKPVDRRSDIYATGIVLWEMLTTQRLFHARDEVEVLLKVRDPQVPSPRGLAPDCPEALEQAVLGALAPEPDQRPQTAGELRRALILAMPEAAAVDPSAVAAVVAVAGADALDALGPEAAEMLRSSVTPAKPGAAAMDELTRPGRR